MDPTALMEQVTEENIMELATAMMLQKGRWKAAAFLARGFFTADKMWKEHPHIGASFPLRET